MNAPPQDIVERLRSIAQVKADFNKRVGRRGKEWAVHAEIEWRAADEIERLRDQVSSAVDGAQPLWSGQVDRMETALKRIANEFGVNHMSRWARDTAATALNVARDGA